MAQNKLRAEMARQFLDALNQGQLPWKACWQQSRPMNAATGKPYRGVNALYLSYAAEELGYTDPRWCTYKQAQDNGWQVQKGAKSCRVEYWAYYDIKQRKLLSWQEAKDCLKADPNYMENMQLRSRVYSVFNAEQIAGIPAITQRHTDIGAIREQRDTLILNMGIGYREEGERAFYSSYEDTVTLPPEASFDDAYSYMATFLHECGHATGHPSRLSRDMSGGFGSEEYAKEELRAEIASAFTVQALGFSLTDVQLQAQMQRHIAYVQNWAEVLERSPEELFRAIKAAEEISDYLIEKGEFEQVMEKVIENTAPNREPTVTILWSESAQLRDGEVMPLFRANTIFRSLDDASLDSSRYFKTKFRIDYVMDGIPGHYEGRQDMGDGDGSLIEHIEKQHTYYLDSEEWSDYLLRRRGKEALEADKEHRALLLNKFVPYLKLHCSLSEMERIAREALQNGNSLLPSQKAYYTALQSYVSECREKLNSGEYNLPPAPKEEKNVYYHFYYQNAYLFTVSGEAQAQAVYDRLCDDTRAMGYSWSDGGKSYRSDVPDAPVSDRAGSDPTVTDNRPFSEALYRAHIAHLTFLCEAADRRQYWDGHVVPDLSSPKDAMALAPKYPWANRDQLGEIAAGIRDDLAPELRNLYAKPEYNAAQMNSIRYALIRGLPLEDVVVLVDPRFDATQMDVIKAGFEAGMSYEQVRAFAKPEIPAQQMLDTVIAFCGGDPWPPRPATEVETSLNETAVISLDADYEPEL